ncbi:MAG: CHAD domain-containing protein [Planctomycetaceae bacterium]|nr:CHAD domain-containing protein [Planctomycetaceae bacterium]
MVQKRKWLDGVRLDDPVSSAARQALEQRLELVWHYLNRASDHAPEPEDVHQLRVSVRRAMAVIEAYGDLLPGKRREWFAKKLKKIRKAANDSRDLEVLRRRVEERAVNEPHEGWKHLLKRLKRLSDKAQRPIAAIAKRLYQRDFEKKIEQLIDRVGWRQEQLPEPEFAEAARQRLRQLAEPFFTAARSDLHQIETLHNVRIAGKRLRYAIEIFAGVSPALRGEIYPRMEDLQERLGQINDHASAIGSYATWLGEWNDPELIDMLERLVVEEKGTLGERLREFHEWWTLAQADTLEEQFHRALQTCDDAGAETPATHANSASS